MTKRRTLISLTAAAMLAATLAGPAMAQIPGRRGGVARRIRAGRDLPSRSWPRTTTSRVCRRRCPVGTVLTLDNQGSEVHELHRGAPERRRHQDVGRAARPAPVTRHSSTSRSSAPIRWSPCRARRPRAASSSPRPATTSRSASCPRGRRHSTPRRPRPAPARHPRVCRTSCSACARRSRAPTRARLPARCRALRRWHRR